MARQRGSPLSELEIVQNPALGAVALWHFGLGFQEQDESAAPLPLAFLVLPLLLHLQTLQHVRSTLKASGLGLFASKLAANREELFAVHERALCLRELTLQSLALGVGTKLLSVGYSEATVLANSAAKAPTIPERLKDIPKGASKVGFWFSKAGIEQVASTLKVAF